MSEIPNAPVMVSTMTYVPPLWAILIFVTLFLFTMIGNSIGNAIARPGEGSPVFITSLLTATVLSGLLIALALYLIK